MAATVVPETKASKTCPVCFKEADRLKVIGECSHTFCEPCLKRHLVDKTSNGTFPCPTCNRDCKLPGDGVGSLPDLPLLEEEEEHHTVCNGDQNVVDDVTNTDDGNGELQHGAGDVTEEDTGEIPQKDCSVCSLKEVISPAKRFCEKCDVNLCEGCGEAHGRRAVTRKHVLTVIDAASRDSAGICKRHDKRLKMFCKPCAVPCCGLCIESSHGDHDVCQIRDILDSTIVELEKVLDKCRSKMQDLDVKEAAACSVRKAKIEWKDIVTHRVEEKSDNSINNVLQQKADLLRSIRDDCNTSGEEQYLSDVALVRKAVVALIEEATKLLSDAPADVKHQRRINDMKAKVEKELDSDASRIPKIAVDTSRPISFIEGKNAVRSIGTMSNNELIETTKLFEIVLPEVPVQGTKVEIGLYAQEDDGTEVEAGLPEIQTAVEIGLKEVPVQGTKVEIGLYEQEDDGTEDEFEIGLYEQDDDGTEVEEGLPEIQDTAVEIGLKEVKDTGVFSIPEICCLGEVGYVVICRQNKELQVHDELLMFDKDGNLKKREQDLPYIRGIGVDAKDRVVLLLPGKADNMFSLRSFDSVNDTSACSKDFPLQAPLSMTVSPNEMCIVLSAGKEGTRVITIVDMEGNITESVSIAYPKQIKDHTRISCSWDYIYTMGSSMIAVFKIIEGKITLWKLMKDQLDGLCDISTNLFNTAFVIQSNAGVTGEGFTEDIDVASQRKESPSKNTGGFSFDPPRMDRPIAIPAAKVLPGKEQRIVFGTTLDGGSSDIIFIEQGGSETVPNMYKRVSGVEVGGRRIHVHNHTLMWANKKRVVVYKLRPADLGFAMGASESPMITP